MLPLTPKGGLKDDNFFVFRTENWTFLEESLLQSFTFSGKVVRHSLAYLSVHKWLVGDVPLYLKIWIYVTHPLLKRHFPVYIRS